MSKRIEHPKVSVIVPTYNRVNELRRCLDSLVVQTVEDFEVIVCDDGSTDNTSEAIKSYVSKLDLTYDYAENFGGPARPRNRGIKLARAAYIAFLDSDDWWTPDKLERSLSVLNAGADVVYHDLWSVLRVDHQPSRHRIRSGQPVSPMFESLLCSAYSIPNSSIVVRGSALQTIGEICEDKDLIAVEDFDMLLRLSKVTEKFVKIPDCLGYYWNGGSNISGASSEQIRRTEAVYRRHVLSLDESKRSRAEALLSYRIGRIAQLQGDWNVAVPNLLSAIRGRLDLTYKLKAVWLLSVRRLLASM
ncbi:MAG: glycosyltransferase family 2 protein [Nitrospiraceae bacterium]|nr:glycosyltransferase family 2 protein [Nitrospiraceae bacterium]